MDGHSCLPHYDDIRRKSVYTNVLKVPGNYVSNFSVKICFYRVYGFHDTYKTYSVRICNFPFYKNIDDDDDDDDDFDSVWKEKIPTVTLPFSVIVCAFIL